MKQYLVVVFVVALISLAIVQVAVAKDDYYGIVESRPGGKVGIWIVGGRSVEVTESTDPDEDNGPLEIGTCAEVDIDEGKVEEIESEPVGKCSK
jgi:hypothetical protein